MLANTSIIDKIKEVSTNNPYLFYGVVAIVLCLVLCLCCLCICCICSCSCKKATGADVDDSLIEQSGAEKSEGRTDNYSRKSRKSQDNKEQFSGNSKSRSKSKSNKSSRKTKKPNPSREVLQSAIPPRVLIPNNLPLPPSVIG